MYRIVKMFDTKKWAALLFINIAASFGFTHFAVTGNSGPVPQSSPIEIEQPVSGPPTPFIGLSEQNRERIARVESDQRQTAVILQAMIREHNETRAQLSSSIAAMGARLDFLCYILAGIGSIFLTAVLQALTKRWNEKAGAANAAVGKEQSGSAA